MARDNFSVFDHLATYKKATKCHIDERLAIEPISFMKGIIFIIIYKNFGSVANLYLHTSVPPFSSNPRYDPCLYSMVWDTNRGLRTISHLRYRLSSELASFLPYFSP